ncbi:glycoside hydrolase family 13 protein [Anaeromicropila herbilytica]|uniref:Neopullulanase n=1 Tax=Anaeromicropila herbilytica TaxID=2785025 RepID=A0A7R7IEE9_9FIRM|nr:glycoside hydrolase family 13 protein [Anaeromicropila herbilytica]BCN32643.1 neopullulanase [Anaeromicropila herbilytica]
MNREALYHCPKSNYAYPYTTKDIRIRFRTAKDDVKEVRLFYGVKFDWANKTYRAMEKIGSDEYFDYYQYNIQQDDIRLGYYFEVITEEEDFFYTEAGMLDAFDDSLAHCLFFQYPSAHEVDIPHKPSWYSDAIFYQIFVERFANGNPDISPDRTVPWESDPTPKSFYGGDLEGITSNLSYLEELGVNAIYLTPIFESISNHKYDTIDYYQIDPHFGSKEDFRELVTKAHEKGIRIILDAVFNHCSEHFAPFQDVIKNGENSRYKDWFLIKEFPVNKEEPNYEMFASVPYMPRLNTANKEVREYLFDVVRYWTKEYDIDGWRLDVADEPDHCFWREFRKVVKEIDKDLIIIGEVWHDSFPWLQGDQFDTVMNYPITNQAIHYFAKGDIDARGFSDALMMQLMKYPDRMNEMMFNLLDSHDTERFLYMCNENKQSLMNAAAFLFGYLGSPCVYYGTEIGLTGGYDPGCRKGFNWNTEEWDTEVHNFYMKLIQIRKTEKALRYGLVTFLSSNDLFIMKRSYEETDIYVVINQTGHSGKLPKNVIPSNHTDLLCSQMMKGNEIMPYTAHYFKISKGE